MRRKENVCTIEIAFVSLFSNWLRRIECPSSSGSPSAATTGSGSASAATADDILCPVCLCIPAHKVYSCQECDAAMCNGCQVSEEDQTGFRREISNVRSFSPFRATSTAAHAAGSPFGGRRGRGGIAGPKNSSLSAAASFPTQWTTRTSRGGPKAHEEIVAMIMKKPKKSHEETVPMIMMTRFT